MLPVFKDQACLIPHLTLDQKAGHLHEVLVQVGLVVEPVRKEQIRFLILIKDIVEQMAGDIEPIETVDVLQIVTSFEGSTLLLLATQFTTHRHRHGLTVLHHLRNVLRQMVQHLIVCHDERILIAVAEGTVAGDDFQKASALHLVEDLPYSRMVDMIRHKPVRQVVKEAEPLHLCKASEVDIDTLSMHVGHAVDALLQHLHLTF